MTNRLSELLALADPIVADGPMGTRLVASGLGPGDAPEAWIVDPARHAAIRAVHRSYREAGAQILLTCSFGANPSRLALHGLGDDLDRINRTAARLARAEAGPGLLVGGSIGPTGELLAPFGPLEFDIAAAGFALQAAALANGGVDIFWIETMSDLAEVKAAVEGCRQAAPSLPVVATLSFGPGGATMMGVGAVEAAAALVDLGVSAGGANCGMGVAQMEPVLAAMHATRPRLPLVAKPNAGLPRIERDQTAYPETPAEVAAGAKRLLTAGAKIVGCCCGGTGEHVQAIARALHDRVGDP